MAYFAVGGGGSAKTQNDSGGTGLPTVDDDATVGVGARMERPFVGDLSIGGQIDFLSYKTEGIDRDISGNFDLWLKARHFRQLTSGVAEEAYIGIPVGFSLLRIADNPALERQGNALGWNIGVMVGGSLFFDAHFGTLIELGWRRIQVYNQEAITGTDVTVITNQFAMNIGYVVVF